MGELPNRVKAETQLYFAKRYALLGEWHKMYCHMWRAMNQVPDDARVPWEFTYIPHDSDTYTYMDGFGWASNLQEQLGDIFYEHKDVGIDHLTIEPAEYDND